MKRIKNNFFFKTFCVSLLMLLLITSIAYLLLYLFLPAFYRQYKIKEYDAKAVSFISTLEQAADEAEELVILGEFAQNDDADVTVYQADGSIFFLATENVGMSVVQDMVSDDVISENEFEIAVDADENGRHERIESKYQYTVGGVTRDLVIDIPLQPLNEAKTVIINIYPIAGLLCVLFSLFLAMLFSRNVVKPIRNIQRTLHDMTQLKSDAFIQTTSQDELAEMSHDINSMYEELRSTILDLEKKIQDYSDSENQKIDFLRNVSHELKSPLASANALIEGIIYEIPPYCDEKDRYLNECREFLQKAIILTKESLSLSPVYKESPEAVDLLQLITSEFRPYKVILKSRQIRYFVQIPEGITFTTSKNLFAKAVSNVLSNAANYTDSGGEVRIFYAENCLYIENTCKPLSEEELQMVMKPMYSGKHGNQLSNGLGLYIVKQSLNLLKLSFSFTPTDSGDGMRFAIRLQ